jgi:hypothetical protein
MLPRLPTTSASTLAAFGSLLALLGACATSGLGQDLFDEQGGAGGTGTTATSSHPTGGSTGTTSSTSTSSGTTSSTSGTGGSGLGTGGSGLGTGGSGLGTGGSGAGGSTGGCCTAQSGPGCSDAAVEQCVCAQDSYCCDTKWDSICVGEVDSFGCGSCGGGGAGGTGGSGGGSPGTQDCCDTSPLPGCNDPTVEQCVCAQDGYCCASAWDSICVSEVDSYACGSCGTGGSP